MAYWQPGQYIWQSRSYDDDTFAVVVSKQKNNAYKVIAIDSGRPKARQASTDMWHPKPVEVDRKDVPDNLLKKLDKYIEQKGIVFESKSSITKLSTLLEDFKNLIDEKNPIEEATADKRMVRAYLEAALWSSTDGDTDEPLDRNFTISDFSREDQKKAQDDCAKFERLAGGMLDEFDMKDVGHNFWLTRNGHGAGFWDGDFEPYGKQLTKIAERFGEASPYVGDDGELYIFSG